MKCIIIDDEPLAREQLSEELNGFESIEIIGSFGNATKALDFTKNNHVDLVFLDIEMPSINGLELAKQLPTNTLFIFTTAYPQFAIDGYELDAIDYLLKPISQERLKKAISKAELLHQLLSDNTIKSTIESNSEQFMFIKADRRFHKLNFEDITHIEALKDYVIIYTDKQKLITAMNLKTIHTKLPNTSFYRVSKSYIVNKNHITSFDYNTLYIDDVAIAIGSTYRKLFFDNYGEGYIKMED
ncbi:LytTR family DNA-binding domain-containing protein [Empedobacter sp. GD03739]|uniref:LytR/AlgR family response regulator transcription factor n=1 Tax=Empedobacter sp. GD03739 TaxID=2975376 RepID=UPI0024487D5B|nr:LytTR family DNA-binding domain-containing protein [Empedobacter sp. GD03739]MDH1603572.1 LytTR family DNA-binding domain-containing protein [Empedobacter sp. GD03739]